MNLLVAAAAALLGAGITYAIVRKKDDSAPSGVLGPIYSIGLAGVPDAASVEDVGTALAQALGWDVNSVLDGELHRPQQGQAVLVVGFKATVRHSQVRLPNAGDAFRIMGADVRVTFVAQAPASTTVREPNAFS